MDARDIIQSIVLSDLRQAERQAEAWRTVKFYSDRLLGDINFSIARKEHEVNLYDNCHRIFEGIRNLNWPYDKIAGCK